MKIACESCQNIIIDREGFICNKCGYLNSISSINFFHYFGYEISVNIDLEKLEERYLELMMIYHPDRFVNKNEKEQGNALSHSSFLNDAYNTLKDTLSRVGYIYEIVYGLEEQEEGSRDYNFNLEFFELYEKLEDIKGKDDIDIFIKEVIDKEEKIIKSLDEEIIANKREFKKLYIKLQFLTKIKKQAQIKK